MFKFTLPKWAMLHNQSGDGQTSHPMVHLGGGTFLMATPPVLLTLCKPLKISAQAEDAALVPVQWDASVFGRDVEMAHQFFDVPSAAEALRVAADGGCVVAISTQAALKAHAREAGLVIPGH